MPEETIQSGGGRGLPTLDLYKIEASTVGKNARTLLQDYSKIPADRVNDHVEKIVSAQSKA